MLRPFRIIDFLKTSRLNCLQAYYDAMFLETEMPSWVDTPQMLLFLVAWLDSKNDFQKVKVKRIFRMTACPKDDTVTLTELTSGFDNALFLRATQLPYQTSDRTRRYYRVSNFRPGIWIHVFKRPMYIYDCEGESTRAYIKQQYGEVSFGDCPREVLEKGPPLERFEILPAELVFKAINREFPSVRFIILYYVNSQRLDIFEQSKLREWSKGRAFLLDVNVSHMSINSFVPDAKLQIFKWQFELQEPHPSTNTFLQSTTEPESEVSQMQMFKDELASL